MSTPNDRYLTLERLRAMIEADEVDTVVLAFTDMQGRLQGKRLHGRYFLDVALESGTEGCNYLLAVDIDMNTVSGYTISSWEKGYGDMEFVPDWDTLRLLPHLPATALVQCDLVWLDHAPVPQSPRTILKTQLEKVAAMDMVALAGTELEFIAFNNTFEDAHDRRWRDLTPVNQYNVDYSLVGTSRVEPLLRDIRNHMYAAGMDVEGAKGECNFGQHEIGFLYAEALVTADNHAVYKTAAKEIASLHGQVAHVHGEVRRARGQLVPHPPVPARRRRRPSSSVRDTTAPRSTTSSWPACSRRWRTSPFSTRRTSTPTSGSPPRPSLRRRSPGAPTTAPAPYAWSATGPPRGWRTGCPAAT